MRCALVPILLLLASPPAAAQVARTESPAQQIDRLVARLRDKSRANEAQAALLRIGRPAVASLLRAVVPRGKVATTAQSKRALRTLGKMGPAASNGFERLVEAVAVCGQEVYLDLLRTLADLVPYSEYQGDPRLVDRLVALNRRTYLKLSRGNQRQRFQYEYDRLLKRSLVDPRQGLKAMIEELRRNRTYRREVAAEVAGRMGPDAIDAVPELARALGKKAPVVGQIGGFSVPEFRDEFPRLGSAAMLAIAPNDPLSAVAWGWRLEHAPRADGRLAAALKLGSFGAKAAGQVEQLVEAMGDPDRRVRNEVITVLGMIGPAARAAIPKLRELAQAPDKQDKATAVRAQAALRSIDKEDKQR